MVHKTAMVQASLSEAKAILTDLVRRAEAGEQVTLTRNGKEVIRLTPVQLSPSVRAKRIAAIEAAQALVGPLPPDFDAARSQDFLYDDDGLPA